MATMQDFVKKFAEANNMKQTQAKELIGKVLDGIFEAVEEEGSFRTSYGTFKMKESAARPARKGRNPATGEEIKIPATPAKKKVAFMMSTNYKKELNS